MIFNLDFISIHHYWNVNCSFYSNFNSFHSLTLSCILDTTVSSKLYLNYRVFWDQGHFFSSVYLYMLHFIYHILSNYQFSFMNFAQRTPCTLLKLFLKWFHIWKSVLQFTWCNVKIDWWYLWYNTRRIKKL